MDDEEEWDKEEGKGRRERKEALGGWGLGIRRRSTQEDKGQKKRVVKKRR